MCHGCRDVISGNLGWVNAQKNGVLAALKALPVLSTEWTFNEDQLHTGGYNDFDEDVKDGRFTCEVCGRSTCVAVPTHCHIVD